jgi:hypothetical protein
LQRGNGGAYLAPSEFVEGAGEKQIREPGEAKSWICLRGVSQVGANFAPSVNFI